MKKALFIVFIVALSVGLMPKSQPKPIIDTELKQYLEMFIKSAKLNKTDLKHDSNKITIQFKPYSFFKHTEKQIMIGNCYACKDSKSDCVSEVYINKTWYDTATPINRRLLLFHELGHCLMNLSHNDTLDLSDSPVSIMNSQLINTSDNDYYNETTLKSYEMELFTGFNPTAMEYNKEYDYEQ